MTEKTLSFGKIDAGNANKRKLNLVEVTLCLKQNDNGSPCFTASASVWNAKHTDIIMGGQCLDHIDHVPENDDLFQEIKGFWMRYHLNDMYAGTIEQIEALEAANLTNASDYTKACEYLKSIGLYEVELNEEEKRNNPRYAGDTYAYGHGWLYRPIPEQDLARIKEIMEVA